MGCVTPDHACMADVAAGTQPTQQPELKRDYAGRFEVEFIDVWKDRGAGQKYGVRMIPTQIFFDSEGNELFRHEGFFAKEDILAKWKEFGVE